MRHWSQLATRNWRAKPVRTLGALLAIALGTGAVVWVSCCYESIRRATEMWATGYIGSSSINIESPFGKFNQLPQRMVPALRKLEEVKHLTVRLDQRLRAVGLTKGEKAVGDPSMLQSNQSTPEMEFLGIDLEHEFHVRQYEITSGRMLNTADGLACMLESDYAGREQLMAGDLIRVWTEDLNKPFELEIVGLFERRRVNEFQKPMVLMQLHQLQEITLKHALITSVDIVLHDPSRAGVKAAARKIRPTVRRFVQKVNITSAEARIRQTRQAQGQLENILTLLSLVSLLTALFIILSTLSMGMIERIVQLGLLRCIGTTRFQLAAIIFIEVLPLGIVGVMLGVPAGLALTQLTVWLAPEYIGAFAVNFRGIRLAVIAGLVTTVIAATLPAIAVLSVSPMDAARPRARKSKPILLASVALAAAVVFGLWYLSLGLVHRSTTFFKMSAVTIVLLYLGFALLGPLAVRFVGSIMVYAAAALTGVRARLLQDQVGHAVWRSAGICCGLMVGLSMIVGLVVFNKSVRTAWEFPRNFPEGYVWGVEQMQPDSQEAHELIASIDGIRKHSVCNAVNVHVEERPMLMAKLHLSVTWFFGVDPDSFFDLMRLEFVEGDRDEAVRLLESGRHIIIAKDFAVARNKKVGDKVRVIFGGRDFHFTVAAVVESPAIDLAATYFQVQSEMRVAAVGSVIGTNADLKRIFGVNGSRLVLLNFDLPLEPPPADWPPPRGSTAAIGISGRYFDSSVPLDKRWQDFRQDRVLAEIRRKLNAPGAYSATVRELKDVIDRQLTGMTNLLTAVPTVALIVAAIGVANLMTANVTSRIRQLAVLRAVGATRGLILRLVIGEALVLGLLGSAMGLALGLALARNTAVMTERMYGFEVPFVMPWGHVGAAVCLTIGLCVLAGIVPARHASQTDVVDALHSV